MPIGILGVDPRTKKGWKRQGRYVVSKWFHRLMQRDAAPYRIAMGCACGIFSSALPIFGQTVIAMFIARLFSASVMASLPWSWISNPLTTLPMWYGGYKLGLWLMPGHENALSYDEIQKYMQNFDTMNWSQELALISSGVRDVLEPLWLGTFLMGIAMAIFGFVVIYWVVITIQRRRILRRQSGRHLKSSKP
jgi:uncharacterized protein (DUF2062 family)